MCVYIGTRVRVCTRVCRCGCVHFSVPAVLGRYISLSVDPCGVPGHRLLERGALVPGVQAGFRQMHTGGKGCWTGGVQKGAPVFLIPTLEAASLGETGCAKWRLCERGEVPIGWLPRHSQAPLPCHITHCPSRFLYPAPWNPFSGSGATPGPCLITASLPSFLSTLAPASVTAPSQELAPHSSHLAASLYHGPKRKKGSGNSPSYSIGNQSSEGSRPCLGPSMIA